MTPESWNAIDRCASALTRISSGTSDGVSARPAARRSRSRRPARTRARRTATRAPCRRSCTASSPREDDEVEEHHHDEHVAPRKAIRQLPGREREQQQREELRQSQQAEVERVASDRRRPATRSRRTTSAARRPSATIDTRKARSRDAATQIGRRDSCGETYAAAGSSLGVSSSTPNSTSSFMIREPSTSTTVSSRPSVRTASPTSGRAAELAEHEPRHRVEVLLLELRAELLVEVVDRERAVDADACLVDAARPTSSGRSNSSSMSPTISSSRSSSVTIPSIVAVLVDDDRHVLLLAPEVGEQRREVLRLRDDVRWAGAIDFELDRRDAAVVHRAEEVAHVEDPDDRRRASRGTPDSA